MRESLEKRAEEEAAASEWGERAQEFVQTQLAAKLAAISGGPRRKSSTAESDSEQSSGGEEKPKKVTNNEYMLIFDINNCRKPSLM